MTSQPADSGNSHRIVDLHAADGHVLSAFLASPPDPPAGSLVVLHEIFGVNAHIRDVCEGFARRGYRTIAPALFDRVERGVELGYDQQAVDRGRALRTAIPLEQTLLDVQAAIDAVGAGEGVDVLGYCWGGTLAFLASTRLAGVRSAISYYGAQTMPFAHEPIRVPVLMHFGEFDSRIPSSDIAAIKRHNPAIEMYSFPADHGFNCDHRNEFHGESASHALDITLAFLQRRH